MASVLAALLVLVVAVPHLRQRGRRLAQEAARKSRDHQLRSRPLLHRAVEVGQFVGNHALLALVVIGVVTVLLVAHRGRDAAAVLLSTAVAVLTVAFVKLAQHDPTVSTYRGRPLGSFPSGHVADITTVTGVVLLVSLPWSRRWFAYAVALLLGAAVAASRYYGGLHTGDDVTAAWFLGISLVCGTGALRRPARRG